MNLSRSRARALSLAAALLLAACGTRHGGPPGHAGPGSSRTRGTWWRDAVVYQIYPRSFQDSNGDGVGDLRGIAQRLPYLRDLGVDAIWLSPIYPSPMVDFGYDVADYKGIDPLFGSMADFQTVVRDAHRLGLRVLLDLVPNHTSDAHPWFRQSRASRSGPRSDWYVWRDPRPDGGLPNNWLSFFGGPAWHWSEERRQYFYSKYAAEQPDSTTAIPRSSRRCST